MRKLLLILCCAVSCAQGRWNIKRNVVDDMEPQEDPLDEDVSDEAPVFQCPLLLSYVTAYPAFRSAGSAKDPRTKCWRTVQPLTSSSESLETTEQQSNVTSTFIPTAEAVPWTADSTDAVVHSAALPPVSQPRKRSGRIKLYRKKKGRKFMVPEECMSHLRYFRRLRISKKKGKSQTGPKSKSTKATYITTTNKPRVSLWDFFEVSDESETADGTKPTSGFSKEVGAQESHGVRRPNGYASGEAEYDTAPVERNSGKKDEADGGDTSADDEGSSTEKKKKKAPGRSQPQPSLADLEVSVGFISDRIDAVKDMERRALQEKVVATIADLVDSGKLDAFLKPLMREIEGYIMRSLTYDSLKTQLTRHLLDKKGV